MPELTFEGVAEFIDRTRDVGGRSGPGLAEVLGDLDGLGLAPGDAVLLAMTNGVDLVRVHLATLLLGLVPLAVSPGTPWERVQALAGHVGARVAVTTRLVGSGGGRPVGGATALPTGAAGIRYEPGEVLLSTSGTSGMFSACVHRVPSLLRNAVRHAGATGLTSSDAVLANLPLYYSYAMVAQVLAAYCAGARLVISGPPFSPAGYRDAVSKHGVTHSALTPTVVRQLLADGAGLPPVRALAVGGDRLAPAEVASLLAARPHGELYLTYGLTEAGPRVSTLAAHAEPTHRHDSVGLPLPGVQVSLRDVRDGVGELLVTSDTALIRRVGPRAARGLVAPGVIATGDAFSVVDGYLRFKGRLSDFVVLKGEKVSLATVRQAAFAIPGVVSCTPSVIQGDDGTPVLDVHLGMTDPAPGAERTALRTLNSLLLPAERPRSVHVRPADPSALRK
ncbi:class I adenylate-forming enzyme family protein [Lentzea sp. NPDC042327]|uniref:class I adenylate-forming enzyme family protein n=1 Tax=Lentzea sp. NPDC042327 TaxID=3154801 RepID=UPI00340FD1E1